MRTTFTAVLVACIGLIAASTAALACGLTWGDPLRTRDAVPRPTPARAATASSVGRPGDRSGCLVIVFLPALEQRFLRALSSSRAMMSPTIVSRAWRGRTE